MIKWAEKRRSLGRDERKLTPSWLSFNLVIFDGFLAVRIAVPGRVGSGSTDGKTGQRVLKLCEEL